MFCPSFFWSLIYTLVLIVSILGMYSCGRKQFLRWHTFLRIKDTVSQVFKKHIKMTNRNIYRRFPGGIWSCILNIQKKVKKNYVQEVRGILYYIILSWYLDENCINLFSLYLYVHLVSSSSPYLCLFFHSLSLSLFHIPFSPPYIFISFLFLPLLPISVYFAFQCLFLLSLPFLSPSV